jgi:hypothetical protein
MRLVGGFLRQPFRFLFAINIHIYEYSQFPEARQNPVAKSNRF